MKWKVYSTAWLFSLLLANSALADLYFPHVACNGSWQTEIGIINNEKNTITGSLNFIDDDGNAVLDPMIVQLASGGRTEINLCETLSDADLVDYIRFDFSEPDVVGYTKFFIPGKYRVAIPAEADINSQNLYIPHIASDSRWWTGISLVNTSSQEKVLTLEFNTGEIKTVTIPAHGHYANSIAGLFGGQTRPDLRSAVIPNAAGIIGLELFGSSLDSADNYLSGVLLKDDTTTTIYYPHIISNPQWWTGIAIYNTSPFTGTLTITPYDQSGNVLNSITQTVDINNNWVSSIANMTLPSESAWLKVDATANITGFELFGTNNGRQLAGYTGVGITVKNGVFPKLDKEGWSGIAIVNIEGSQADVLLRAYDDNGNLIDDTTITLKGFQKLVTTVEAIFENIDNATYLRFASANDLVGFQLNGSEDEMMLDGLPALPDNTFYSIETERLQKGTWSGNNFEFELTKDGVIKALEYTYGGDPDCYKCRFSIESIPVTTGRFYLANNNIGFVIEGIFTNTNQMSAKVTVNSTGCTLSNEMISADYEANPLLADVSNLPN